MALSISNNMTLWHSLDSSSGWASIGAASSTSTDTDRQIEGNACFVGKLSNARGGFQTVSALTSLDFDDAGSPKGLVSCWVFTTSKLTDTATTGGITLRIGSAQTDWVEWQVALGSAYPGGWQRITVDVSQTADSTAGTIDWTAVTYFALQFDSLTPIMGNIKTILLDRIDVLTAADIVNGTACASVTGTTTTAGELFEEIFGITENQDRGYVTRLGNIYFLNGPLEFGATTGTNTFTCENEICTWSPLAIAGNGFMFLKFIGGSGTDTVTWGEKVTGENIGSKGATIFTSGPKWDLIAAETDIDTFQLYACTFDGCNDVKFGDTSTELGTTGDTVHMIDNIFKNCGRIIRNIGADTVIEVNNKVTFNTDATASIDLIDESEINISKWDIIQSPGFIHTPTGTPTLLTLDYNFGLFTKPYMTIDTNDTWQMDNATVTINTGTHDELDFLNGTGNSVEKRFDIDILARRGVTNIQNVYTWLGYTTTDGTATTDTANNTLPTAQQQATAADGTSTSKYVQDIYTYATASTLDDTPKTDAFLLAYHYPDKPMFRTLGTVTDKQDFRLAVIADPNISETTQATAITNGSGITFTKDSTTPFAVVFFTAGNGGTINSGDTVRGGTSGATGLFKEFVDGDGNGTGAMLVENVSATAFTNGETLDTDEATTWTGTSDETSNPRQEFDWGIDCNAKSLQITYDFISAKLAEVHANVLSSNFDEIIKWCEDETDNNEGLMVQALGGDTYKTSRNARLSEGVILYNYGAGTISQFTDNAGTAYTPPSTVTLDIHCQRKDIGAAISGVQILIKKSSDGSTIASGTTNGSGDFQPSFAYISDIAVEIFARKSTLPVPRFLAEQAANTITNVGFTQTFLMTEDSIVAQV